MTKWWNQLVMSITTLTEQFLQQNNTVI